MPATVPPGSVTIEGNNFQYPPATEEIVGVSEVATQEEVDAGTDGWRFVVPAKLKAWWDKVRVWNNIKNKPETATRWPTHEEVEGLGTSAILDARQDDGQVALIGDLTQGNTSVVVESGSNANGYYRIYSDGYIEQKIIIPVTSSGDYTFIFPVPINNTNSLRSLSSVDTSQPQNRFSSTVAVLSESSGSVSYQNVTNTTNNKVYVFMESY